MVVNPEKFQAIILEKGKHDSNEAIEFDNKTVETVSSVRILGVQVDGEINFSLHVSNISTSANRLNTLIRFNNFLCFEEKRVFISSYFMSNFNYCLLIWMFSNATSLKKLKFYKKEHRDFCTITASYHMKNC